MSRVNPDVKITSLPSAEEAISYMERVRDFFDLCIFDINLPALNGLDLLSKVKPWHPVVPMMILSSSDSEACIRRAFAAGADGYIVKPFAFTAFQPIARYICDCWFDGKPSEAAQQANVRFKSSQA